MNWIAEAVRSVVYDLLQANWLLWQLPIRMRRTRGAVSAPGRGWSNSCWGLRVEPLESRVLMSTVTWVNAAGGDWNTASNWSSGQVPGASDDAVINVSGNPTITFSSGTDTVNSITSNSPLSLSGGTLTVNSTVQVNNTFTLNGGTLAGATVQAGSGGQGITIGTSTASRLDGDTVNANLDLTSSYAFLKVKDGLALSGTAALGGAYATIDFENTQTIASGTFVSQGTGGGRSLDIEGGATVTLGSGVTVHGGNATIGNVYTTGTAHTLVNQGMISADVAGQSLTITSSSSYPLTLTNQGTLQAVSGGGLTSTATGSAASTGTIGVDGTSSSLTLNSTWNGLGTLSATNSGTMNLDGTFNNSASTISLPTTSGSWVLNGGTINGGTLTVANGAVLSASSSTSNLLDGVTVNGNISIGNYGFLGIKDGLALNGTATFAASYATVDFKNTETISSGTFQFGSSGSGFALDVEGGATVTLGSGVTIEGGNGNIGEVYNTGTAHALINQGTIDANAAGRPLTIGSYYSFAFTNQGTAEATGGATLTAKASSGASSTGTLSADGSGSALTLNGAWTGLGTLSATNSGTVNLDGTFNNAGSTISLPNSGGNWVQDGGTINGGTLTIASGAALLPSGNGANLLDGVTVNGNIQLGNYAFLGVKDGLTLNGIATFAASYATVDFENTETVQGGTFQFGSSGYGFALDVEGGATVTLGSAVTVQGGNGNIGEVHNTGTAHTLINQGTINANVAGRPVTISSYYPLTFSNQGTLEATAGASLTASASSGASNSGTLSVDGSGSSVTLNGPWNGLSTLSATNSGTMNFDGTFNNVGNTIALGATGGSWVLNGGTINGGTVSVATGAVLSPSGSGANLLDGVTFNGNLSIGNYGFLGVKDGLSLNGTATFAASYATVDFENTETISSGTFQFGSSGYGFALDVEGGATVTLGSAVMVQGGSGNIGDVHNTGTAHTLINQGTITSNLSGKSLTVGSYYPFTFTNQGTLQAVGGASLTASAASGASNAGTLAVDGTGSSLTLSGTWNGAGTLSATSSGTMNLGGTFDNAGATISLGATGGNWVLNGGTINGGTLNIAAGASLSVSGSTANLLDGTTVTGSFGLPSYGFLGIKDGLTLNGTVTLGNSAVLDFKNTQTLSGGTVQLPASGNAGNIDAEAGATLTLGSVTIAGGIGTIGNTYSGGAAPALANQGTISATGTAANIALAGTWTALGTLSTTGGGVIRLTTTFNNAGQTTTLGGTLTLDGGAIVGGTVDLASGTMVAATSNKSNLLDGVTVNGNLDLTAAGAFLGVKDGLTLNGTATLGGTSLSYYPYNSPTVDFQNTQTISAGTFVLPSSGSSGIDVEGGTTVTLAGGVTVHGGDGSLGGAYSVSGSHTLINQGLISADVSGQTINLTDANLSFNNPGIAQAINGATLNISPGGTATSTGTLNVSGSGSKLTLGGGWSGVGFGSLNNSGGTATLTGTLNNAGNAITVGGSLLLDGGSIVGGTVNLSSSATLSATGNTANLLDGVTVNGNLNITSAGAFLGIKDGLTLNGTATVGGNDRPGYPYNWPLLDIENTSTIGGSATILFANFYGNLDVEGGATATLASGVTIHGGRGTLGNTYSGGSTARTLVNQGTITADVASQAITVSGAGLTFTNQGTAQATAGALQLNTSNDSTVTVSNTGTLSANGTASTVTLGGTWASGSVGTLNAASGGTIDLNGTFNNATGTIALAGSGGSYVLTGGTITGGTVDVAVGAALSVTSGSFRGGVTVNGNLNLSAAGALLGIKDGLTLNGTATMGGNESPGYPYNFPSFDFQNTGTLGGNATLLFTNGYAGVDVESGATLTLAAGVTIHGGGGSIGNAYSNSAARTIVNYGTISVDAAGQTLAIDGGSNLTFINYGLVEQTAAGSSVSFTSNLASLVNHGTIAASGGGNVNVTPHAFSSGGTIHVVGSSTIDDAGTTISSTAAAVDGVDGAMSWNGLPSGGGASVSLSSSTDGVDFSAFAAPLISASASLIGNLTPGSSNVLRASSTANGTTVICDSAPLTTPNTADQSGWYQISSPVGSYSSNGYNWTLNGGWVHAGSPEAALAVLMVGLIPLGSGGPVVGSDGAIHLYHATGYDTANTIDFWSWTRPQLELNAVETIYDYTLGVNMRSGPPSTASGEDPNAAGGDPAQNGQSTDPVRYFDGSIVYNATDLESDGFGSPFGQIRSWTNLTQYASNGRNGTGMVDNSLPFLQQADGSTSVTIVDSGSNIHTFDLNGSTYVPESFVADTLVHANGQYVYTDTSGNQYTFYDFSTSYPAAQRGEFAKLTDAAGAVTYVSGLNADGTIAEIRRKDSTGTDRESWLYNYLPTSDPNSGLLQNVQLRRPDGQGGWTMVRQVSYAYYDGTTPYGNLGDLKTATIEDPSGTALDTDYYRYYVAGEAGGYAHGLKYAFDAASYARLAAAVTNPFTAPDSAVAPYAQHYFQYDALRRVTRHTVQGAGGPAAGGLGTFTYQYFTSTNAAGPDSWQYKTIETLPDGNQNIVYCNSLGEVMLKVYNDISDPANSALSGKQWETFYGYDVQGRLTEEADPSAVTGYDETKADLLNNQNGNYQYLSDNSGLIHLTDYYTSTTATATAAGGAAGYIEDDKVQHGELGTPILLDDQQYFAHTNGSIVTYPQASQTVYRNTDGTGAETTTSAYTWYPNSSQAQSMTTSKPVVSAAENGPAAADVSTVFYDPYGRVIWSKDAEGYVNYTGYDTGTGAVVQTITDIDYSKLSAALQQSFNLNGWAQPTGGLHLVTSTVVDGLGRPIQITDPNGNVTYMTYDDANHEIRTYAGWNAATGTPTGPTIVVREDRAGSYTETLTMTATPHLTNGVPDGTEPISGIQSLERQYTDTANQVVEIDQYFNLSGLTYSTAAHIGTLNTNYYTMIYGFDVNGHQARVQDAVGTITDTLFDGLGRPTAVYVGTNDTTTNGNSWSPSNAAASSNMLEVAVDQYDANGVGDGNLTQMTSFPDATAADNRVTANDFDWRDRLVSTKSGVQTTEDTNTYRPLTVNTLDNLGEVTVQSTYDGDGVSMTDANQDGVPDALNATNLRSQLVNSYDDQDRVYRTTVSVIDQNTGAVTGTLVSNEWYDRRGNLIKMQAANGLVTKDSYDGAGRLTNQSSTDGGGDTTWADAGNVTGDIVLGQVQNVYDSDGNVVETVTKQREGDDASSATGALGDFTTDPKARVSYVASYFDAANRVIDVLNVGTNGGATFTPPAATSLVSDDTHLLTSYAYDAAGFQSTVTDPRGIVAKTLRDALGRPTSVINDFTDGTPTDTSNQTIDFTYDGLGHVLSKTLVQPAGGAPSETTAFVYGVTGNIFSNDLIAATKYPDPATGAASAANQETYAYDRLGEVISKSEPNGSSITSLFDVLGRLRTQTVNTTDGSGNPSTQFTYDTLGNVSSQTDPKGNLTTFDHDSLGRKTQQVLPDPDGHSGHPTTTWTYDAAGNVISTTDARGNTTTFNYDLLSRQIQETLPDPDGTGPLTSPVITHQYNVAGNQTTTTDALGNLSGANAALHTTTNVADQFGRLAETIQPSADGVSAQPTTSFGYDRDGNLTSVTDALGNTTTNVYDNLNRKVQVTAPDPDGSGPLAAPVTYYAYDALGNLLQVTDSLGHATNYQYDALNRKTETIQSSPDGIAPRPTTIEGYDITGNLTSVTDALGNVTTNAYNQLNEKISQTDPDPDGAGPLTSPVTQYAYDLNGNLTQVTDPLGHATNYDYDALNRKTETIQPSPDGTSPRPTTITQYDSVGNVVAVTDPVGNTTAYVYDNLNRPTSVTDQKGNPQLTSYDANGNAVSTTDRNGQVTTFIYDNLNRQTAEQWLDSGSNVIRTITSTYDLLGRLTSVSDPASTTSYAYDNLNRPITITISYTGLSESIVLNQSFDAAGRRTSLTSNLGLTPDLANSYLYDALDRLTQVQQASNGGNAVAAKQVNFGYNANGQVTTVNRYSDLTGSNLVAASTYGYDYDSRLTSLVHALGPIGSTSLAYGLSYDANSRITSLTTPDGASTLAYDNNGQLTAASLTSESYSYDANGNRTSGGTTTTADNQLASDNIYTYSYDKNGNLTGKVRKDGTGSVLYTWDYRNRLTDVVNKDGTGTVTQSVHYAYDTGNNRISKTVKDGSGNVTLAEYSVYDGGNLLLVLDGSGNVKNRYVNGPNDNQVLAEETNISGNGAGTTHWALTDHEGSVRDVVGNSGTVLDHIQYDSFGNVLSQTNSANAMRMRYTGQQFDPETGLYYDHARYYDPATGRFLSTDPSGFSAGDANLYRYVGNSPLDNTDPTGMTSMSDRWNTFWGNVGSYYHQALPSVNAFANMDAYYNGSAQQRAATDAAAAQTWGGAIALNIRNVNIGLWQLGETATKATGDAMIYGAADMADAAGANGLAADLRNSTTGTLDSLPGTIQSWLDQQRADHAKRVQAQLCAGKAPWEANLLATGLTFLNMLGIAPTAEGLLHYDLTNQQALSDGESKMRTVGGLIQVGSWLLPSVNSAFTDGAKMSSFRLFTGDTAATVTGAAEDLGGASPRATITDPPRLLPAPTPPAELPTVELPSSGEPFIVTPRGVAVSPGTLAQQGTSPLVGDFTGLNGASVDEIISRVPDNWTMVPQDRGVGIKFLDDTGAERIRLHAPSVRAPAGSNSASGWTMRVMDQAGGYYDDAGNLVSRTANEGHIPVNGNPNAN